MGKYVEVGPGEWSYRGGWKPHMERRSGETPEQHSHRLSRSCYRCGYYEEDEQVLDAHEDTCTGTSSVPLIEERS